MIAVFAAVHKVFKLIFAAFCAWYNMIIGMFVFAMNCNVAIKALDRKVYVFTNFHKLMISSTTKVKLLNFYPPYFFAGIKIVEVNEGLTRFVVEMKLRFWNKNLFGTHFGGSLYSMCDPFFTFIFVENLGKNYIVWDKAASIRFRKPGRGTMRAVFELSKEEIEAARAKADNGQRDFVYQAKIVDESNEVVAEVEKVVYIKPREL